MLSFGTARVNLAEHVGNGLCADSPRVGKRLFEAQERLIERAGWRGTLSRCIFNVLCGGHIILPEACDSIVSAAGNSSWTVRGKFFEFQANGPGGAYPARGSITLVEGDRTPIQRDMPIEAGRIWVLSDTWEADDAVITIIGLNEYKQFQTEEVPIVHGHVESNPTKYSTKEFLKITGIKKPITAGNVTIAHYDPATTDAVILATYAAYETEPDYQTYVVPHGYSSCTVDAVTRMRVLPLVHDDQPMVIQSQAALRLMLKALSSEEGEDTVRAQYFEDKAFKILNEQLAWTEGFDVKIQFDPRVYGGAVPDAG